LKLSADTLNGVNGAADLQQVAKRFGPGAKFGAKSGQAVEFVLLVIGDELQRVKGALDEEPVARVHGATPPAFSMLQRSQKCRC
jgi:hypothetical protein